MALMRSRCWLTYFHACVGRSSPSLPYFGREPPTIEFMAIAPIPNVDEDGHSTTGRAINLLVYPFQ